MLDCTYFVAKISYMLASFLLPLQSTSSELSERLLCSVRHWLKLNSQLLHCTSFFSQHSIPWMLFFGCFHGICEHSTVLPHLLCLNILVLTSLWPLSVPCTLFLTLAVHLWGRTQYTWQLPDVIDAIQSAQNNLRIFWFKKKFETTFNKALRSNFWFPGKQRRNKPCKLLGSNRTSQKRPFSRAIPSFWQWLLRTCRGWGGRRI